MGLFDGILQGIGGAIISGAGSFLGATQQNAQSAAAQLRSYYYDMGLQNNANAMNVQNATTAFNRSQEQLSEVEAYNTSMANTAFQRQVADLKAAGLNPILGIGGSGASAPTVSAAPPSAPTMGAGGVGMPSFQNALGQGVSSALQGAKLFSELKQQAAQTATSEEIARLTHNQADAAGVEAQMKPGYLAAQIGQLNAAAGQSGSAAALSAAQTKTEGERYLTQGKQTEYVGAQAAGETKRNELIGRPTVSGGIPGLFNITGQPHGALGNVSPISPPYSLPPGRPWQPSTD